MSQAMSSSTESAADTNVAEHTSNDKRHIIMATPSTACDMFITLSYTWGGGKNLRVTKSNLEELQEPGALRSKKVVTQLPATILDAIELTRTLGEKWLWVDSLCTLQDDDEGLKRELAAVNRIYATSFLTIVAADGEDAEYGLRGLRGISKPRVIKQRVESLSQGERIAYRERPKSNNQVTNGRKYHHRTWTSQEYDFSKRRLIFEDGQVTWQCNHTEWSEDHLHHPEHEKLRMTSPYGHIGHEAYLKVPSLNRLSYLVQTFNARTMCFGGDVYDAFAGYNIHLNSIFPHGLVYGQPQLFFDISLCWQPIGSIRRRTVSAQCTKKPLRNGLPSWSWMGWEGHIYFPGELEVEIEAYYEMAATEAITDWYAMEHPGSTHKQPIHSQWSQCRKAPPGFMAELWRCEEFKPPATFDTRIQRIETEPRAMPKEMPRYRYHCSLDDSSEAVTRWYPIPLNLDDSDGSQTGLHSGYQYLWCQTSRAFLVATQDTIKGYGEDAQFHLLKNQSGSIVGALRLHDAEDGKLFQVNTHIELIAIAKGWTVILSRFGPHSAVEAEMEPESKDEDITADCSEDGTGWSETSEDIPWMEKWEDAKKHKQDCYHVLWIEWKDGVACRKSAGFVLEEEWEKVAEVVEPIIVSVLTEVNKIDITLG
ncbi:unnamed protein product [Fusarium langsethiae]|nr:unnamed protein product [Fusarium langsethiae]